MQGVATISNPFNELKTMGHDRDFGKWHDLEGLAAALSGGMPRYNSARLAGMFAEHTFWYTDESTRRTLLKPLAERALKLSPHDTQLWRTVSKFKISLQERSAASNGRDLLVKAYRGVNGAVMAGLDPRDSDAASKSKLLIHCDSST